MVDTVSEKKPRTRSRKRLNELEEFSQWLTTLGLPSTPKIHVNGPAYTMAVLAVDFGTPLGEPIKLTPEQSALLINHLRTSTKSLFRDRAE